MRNILLKCLVTVVVAAQQSTRTAAFSINSIFTSAVAVASPSNSIVDSSTAIETPVVPKAVNKIAVAGATGRTGAFVVQELLDRGIDVVALVRDNKKAETVLGDFQQDNDNDDGAKLQVVQCDLGNKKNVISSVEGCDAAIWCATGFSNNPSATLLDKAVGLFGVLFPKQGIDYIGLDALGAAFNNDEDKDGDVLPKVVMLSSAGVTRPSWDEAKKMKYEGCADIPIVRLNPFGILDIKAESEEILRKTGVSYSIFRPTGLNDDQPSGSRPVFSQGDVAVGRINRKDCAKILVDSLTEPESVGKTYEAFTLAGFAPASSIGTQLSRMRLDSEGPLPDDILSTTYFAMQQLLPGEKQDAAALAMGQTYEQLDKDETGRLGERGEENIDDTGYKPSPLK